MAIITTPKATDANSYISIADADSYFTNERLHDDTWTSAADTVKEPALRWATRMLDDGVEWEGARRTEDQALRWPRSAVKDQDGYTLDEDTIPYFLERATAELAMLLIASDRSAEPDTQGFSRIKVGPIELEIDKLDQLAKIPDSVSSIFAHYGVLKSGSSSFMQADLVRV